MRQGGEADFEGYSPCNSFARRDRAPKSLACISHFAQLGADVLGPTPHAVAGLPYGDPACAIDRRDRPLESAAAKAR